MNKTLTIVIPSYNVSSYVERCIGSILSQDTDDYSIIVVDDHSTDNTVAIIKERFASKIEDGVITVIELEKNGGSAIARQTALEIVTTPYVTFVDADDSYASCNAVSMMVDAIKRTEADMYMFKYITDHGRVKLKKRYSLPHRILSGEEAWWTR